MEEILRRLTELEKEVQSVKVRADLAFTLLTRFRQMNDKESTEGLKFWNDEEVEKIWEQLTKFHSVS